VPNIFIGCCQVYEEESIFIFEANKDRKAQECSWQVNGGSDLLDKGGGGMGI
jgi:hypothetical protein